MPNFASTPFLERLVIYLLPYFLPMTQDNIDFARAEVLETMAAYGARTRAQLLNVVQIIAFGLSALDTLGEAKTPDLSPSMRLRYRGCANNLNRSSHNAEKILANSLKCEVPGKPARQAKDKQSQSNHAEDTQEDLPVEEILHRIDAEIAAKRQAATSNRLANPPRPDTGKRQKGSEMFDALFGQHPEPAKTAAAWNPGNRSESNGLGA